MPAIQLNEVELHYEVQGSGPPLVLVHGSMDRHEVWTQAAERLARHYRVISYDRRGHSRSERPPGARSRIEDENDLAALIETLAGEPAYVAANSFGGVISLALAARRPELFRALAVHEPPALSAADGGELEMQAQGAMGLMQEIIGEIEAGAVESGTRRFVEEIALGPGARDLIPPDDRAALVQNAPAFVAEQRDPSALDLDIAAVRRVDVPLLLTKGEESPPLLRMLLDRLAELLPAARTSEIPGAGHVPHETHPDAYAGVIAEFLAREQPLAA